jgi:hypothetical protein
MGNIKITVKGQVWGLKPEILATWEVEIGKITSPSQPRENVQETPIPTTSFYQPVPVISAMQGSTVGGLEYRPAWVQVRP